MKVRPAVLDSELHVFNEPPDKRSARLKITVPSESRTFHSVRWT